MRVISEEAWALPLYAASCTTSDGTPMEYVCPTPGINGPQFDKMLEYMRPFLGEDMGMFWLLPEGTIQVISKPCPGVTPNYHIQWPGHTRDTDKVIDLIRADIISPEPMPSDISSESEEFLREIVEKTGIIRLADLRVIWSAIQQEGAEWLYRKNKVIDLGFTRLVALPYRANWRAWLVTDVKNLIVMFRKRDNPRDAQLESIGFLTNLYRTSMIEFHEKTKTVGWTIDSLPTKQWDEYVKANESSRLQALSTPERYLRWWSFTITKLHKNIYDSLKNYLEKVGVPIAGLDPGRFHSGPALVRLTSNGRVRAAIPEQPRVDPANPPLDDKTISGPPGEYAVVAAAAPVPEMPVIRFGKPNVRNNR